MAWVEVELELPLAVAVVDLRMRGHTGWLERTAVVVRIVVRIAQLEHTAMQLVVAGPAVPWLAVVRTEAGKRRREHTFVVGRTVEHIGQRGRTVGLPLA